MPIYEYVCKACGHATEIMHKISDPAPKKCPECGKLKLSKQMSATGFRLSGGGWYETDFKSGNQRNVAGDKDKPAAKPAEAGKDGKTEAGKDGKTKEAAPAPKKEAKEANKEPKKDSKDAKAKPPAKAA